MSQMIKKTQNLNDLQQIIGTIKKSYDNEIANNLDAETIKNVDSKQITSEYYIYQVGGLNIQTRFKKVQESFKIKPFLKNIVENVVKEAQNNGQRISKGEIYNLLIETGLKTLKNQ